MNKFQSQMTALKTGDTTVRKKMHFLSLSLFLLTDLNMCIHFYDMKKRRRKTLFKINSNRAVQFVESILLLVFHKA